MKLKSLILNNNRLEIAEVELEFIPGIPQIHFLGLPDRLIKESFYRIKSALKSSGYKFPLTSQMIVNIKPSHLRKSSRGVEFAVALGILLKTNQISLNRVDQDWIIYGELGLNGEVYEPSDLAFEVLNHREKIFLTGLSADKKSNAKNIFRVRDLKKFEIDRQTDSKNTFTYERPTFGFYQKYSNDEAEFLFLTAASGLHALLAGPSGAGKSTLAKALLGFSKAPQEDEKIRLESSWRPLVNPHQSMSPAAFTGGGAYLHEGEIERAQGGILLLDEFLEFKPEILESLRGPMTGESLRLSRGAGHRQVNSDFQVIATTNLCPCGKWTPDIPNIGCRYSRMKCTRTLEKLSGPILDRFSILFFVEPVPSRNIDGLQILQRIELTQKFLKWATFKSTDPLIEEFYSTVSARRKKYLNQIASLFALERVLQTKKSEVTERAFQVSLQFQDYTKAERWVITPFVQLEKGMG